MLKKTIEFTNVDGVTETETHYFNLSTADLTKMQIREGEGFQDYLTRIVESGDGVAIIETFEMILRAAYGIRTSEGKFIKPAGAFDEFVASEAYSALFMELVTDAKKSGEFINGIVPSDLSAQVEKAKAGISDNLAAHLGLDDGVKQNVFDNPVQDVPKGKRQPRSQAELLAAYRAKNDAMLKPHPYKNMPLERAMDLSPNEFQEWLNQNAE